jgi:hypothetical protein
LKRKPVLDLQVLFLTLIPVFSGIVPHDGLTSITPSALFGISEPLTKEFLMGTWKTSEEFFKWGITDREKATLRPFRKAGYVSFNRDGTLKMANLFQPTEGRWEIRETGLVLTDPRYPQATERVVPLRKRDHDRIWLLLPFSGGAIGVGMVRVPDEEFQASETAARKDMRERAREKDRFLGRTRDVTVFDSSEKKGPGDDETAERKDQEPEPLPWPR